MVYQVPILILCHIREQKSLLLWSLYSVGQADKRLLGFSPHGTQSETNQHASHEEYNPLYFNRASLKEVKGPDRPLGEGLAFKERD